MVVPIYVQHLLAFHAHYSEAALSEFFSYHCSRLYELTQRAHILSSLRDCEPECVCSGKRGAFTGAKYHDIVLGGDLVHDDRLALARCNDQSASRMRVSECLSAL